MPPRNDEEYNTVIGSSHKFHLDKGEMTLDWLFGNSELQLREQDEAGASSFPEYQRNVQFRH